MVILITGITSGFGYAMARRLCADGHIVYGTYRKEAVRIPGVNYLKVDVRNTNEVERAVESLIHAQNHVDVFINNAGMGIGGPLECTSIEDMELQMDTNYMGMVRFMNKVVPIMRKQRHGQIICISSIGGLMGLPYQGAYSASKFAMEGYCEALRLELKPFSVHVSVINPGDFHTAFTEQRKKVDAVNVTDAYPGYANSMQTIENDEQGGLTPDYLAGRIARIITKRHPRNRYIVATPMQRSSVFLKRILPASWFDHILSNYYKL